MAKRAGPKTRRMSPGRRAVTRLERLKELSTRVTTGRIGDLNPPSAEPSPTRIGQSAPDTTSSRQDAPAPLAQPNLVPVYLPARMINEFVYCPRLFYYEQVEGVFVESAEYSPEPFRICHIVTPSRQPLADRHFRG